VKRYFTQIAWLCLIAVDLTADGPGVIVSVRSDKDLPLTADPQAAAWKNVAGVFAENDSFGRPVPGLRTEIRSRWTDDNLYLLFICPFHELYLNPNPSQSSETNKLWERDVAETFIGGDFQNVRRYREFQVSPKGEWVDLDIDRDSPLPEGGWRWNSGFTVTARIDEAAKVWYGAMKVPFRAIAPVAPKPGGELRINFYRFQGPDRKKLAWQPTNKDSFHVPEAFGRLRLK
jgi:hypothetical protein